MSGFYWLEPKLGSSFMLRGVRVCVPCPHCFLSTLYWLDSQRSSHLPVEEFPQFALLQICTQFPFSSMKYPTLQVVHRLLLKQF